MIFQYLSDFSRRFERGNISARVMLSTPELHVDHHSSLFAHLLPFMEEYGDKVAFVRLVSVSRSLIEFINMHCTFIIIERLNVTSLKRDSVLWGASVTERQRARSQIARA